MQQWIVTKAESGMRLLDFIRSKSNLTCSARQLKRSIEAGDSLINGKVERFASKPVGKGDVITFHFVESSPKKTPPIFSPQNVLYVDEGILIYNKPASVSSESPNFLAAIQTAYPRAKLVHRLDRDTTGALIFSLNDSMNSALLELFKMRKVQKTYYALADGVPSATQGIIKNYLGKLGSYQGQNLWGSVPAAEGNEAITQWKVKVRAQTASLMLCYPETGRTHQIRVHMSGLGCPILGDYQYGKKFKCLYRPPRMMLHAFEIAFQHPLTKHQLRVEAPLPPDFISAMKQLNMSVS